jgi:hypothetical protein
MFQYLPSPATKEILDSVSSMSPCIVMKDDGVRCQQMSSLSPECCIRAVRRSLLDITEVDALMVSNAFLVLAESDTHEWAIIMEECMCVYLR